MKRYISFLFIVVFFISCYEEENIKSELGENKLYPLPGDTELENEVYEFFKETNSVIIYKYEELDYRWNWRLSSFKLTPQEDESTLVTGIKFFNKIFGDCYSDEFRKKNFPPKIYLAKDITQEKGTGTTTDLCVGYGNDHIAIGRIRNYINDYTQEETRRFKASVNAVFWSYYMMNNNKLSIPADFFKPCKSYYGQNFLYTKIFPENEGKTIDEVDTRDYGFWSNDKEASWGSYYMAPKEELDVYQYIEKITSTDFDEIKPVLEEFPLIRQKYIILINYIKENFGIDLQEVGNSAL